MLNSAPSSLVSFPGRGSALLAMKNPSRLLSLSLLVASLAGPALGQDGEMCLECHGSAEDIAFLVDDPRPSLVVDGAHFGRSVHASFSCSDCHFGFDDPPHGADAESIGCVDCHDDVSGVLEASVHGAAVDGGPVACTTCHGTHDVLRASDRESRLNPLNVYRVCGQCHFDVDVATATVDELLKEPYTDDAHAEGILRAGLMVSATCVSCHGGHGVKHGDDPESPVSRLNVDQTCGKCHVGVLEQYRESVHHVVSVNNGHKGATCSDCHRPHAVAHPDHDFRVQSIEACSECHEQRSSSFRLSFHGKASTLGFGGEVATCGACHGNHLIVPKDDPRSRVHEANIVATCGQCHEGSHTEFTKFVVHADPTDGERFPTLYLVWVSMSGLLVGTLVLGMLHVLMWLVRGLAAGDWRRPKPKSGRRWIQRWPASYIVYHIWLMWTVLILASTGLPLHYADQPWALGLMDFFGGAAAAGWVHRATAVALGLLFAMFAVHILWRWLAKREKGLFWGSDTMLPRVKDLADLRDTVKWFLFLGPRPRYGRWIYWEKFDFWAATWGLFVIGLSGLILWFPVQATHFMPGWFVNVATIIHGIEALLDIAFIFTVHMFHANLRPDKFPIDTMFLTGALPEDELRHERPEEYEQLAASGGLAALVVDRPRKRLRAVATVLGWCAMGLGFFFVAMMLLALIRG